MNNKEIREPFVLGAFICIGLALLGYLIAGSVTKIKALNRSIEVKGLSEREVPINIAIWPIKFKEADNDLNNLFSAIQRKNVIIIEFLKKHGFKKTKSLRLPLLLLINNLKNMQNPIKVSIDIQAVQQ